MMKRLLACALVFGSAALAQDAPDWGIKGYVGPKWQVSEWIQPPAGFQDLEVTDFRGRILVTMNFQMGCPGCHSHGFPYLKRLMKAFEGSQDVRFVVIQTVFEGFDHNDAQALPKVAKKFGLKVPIGHDPGSDGKGSNILRSYRTRGTPWFTVFDQRGVVRRDENYLKFEDGKKLITELLGKLAAERKEATAALAGWSELPRLHSAKLAPKNRSSTLIRFWRAGDSDDAAAIKALAQILGRMGEKAPRLALIYVTDTDEVDAATIRSKAKKLGHQGAIHADRGGSMLGALTETRMLIAADAPTLLLDAEGSVVFALRTTDLSPHATAERSRDARRQLRMVLEERFPTRAR